jgi:3-deoxy-D-manno-octulosonic-acid transferase
VAGLVGWPYFYWHLKSRGRGESFLPRLGLTLPDPPPTGHPRIWVHGVSVGEIQAALPLVKELKVLLPQAAFIITTGTETGQAVARQQFAPLGALVCYFPLDLPWAVHRYLKYLRPHLFVALDSEIWPNFLTQAQTQGVRLALANARLSDKSFRRFIRYRRYVIGLFNLFDIVAAGSRQDYDRLRQLGVSPDKLHLTGNLKCDRLLQSWDDRGTEGSLPFPHTPLPARKWAEEETEHFALPQPHPEFAAALKLQGEPVFLAASTHPGEEAIVLEAYEKLRGPYPTLLLILAPRHPERAGELTRLLARRGLSSHLWTLLKSGREVRRHPVVVIDTIGDLFNLYGLADLSFVGGSLIPHGGQNILEPAAWGRSPLYGPHLQNFRWAQAILEEAGAGLPVHDAPSLTAAAQNLLDHPETRLALGARARGALTPHRGAARRQAILLAELVPGGGG